MSYYDHFEPKAPKFTHIMKPRASRGGDFTVTTLCGRRTNLMNTRGNESEVTCTRCLAEHLAMASASVAEG